MNSIFKNTTFFTLIIGSLLLSSLVSCSNSTSLMSNTNETTYAKNISSGPWLMNSVVSTQNTEIFDLYSEMDSREKDNSLIFNSDKSVVSDEGASKYSENDPQILEKGNWTINAEGTILRIEEYGMVSELQIIKLTANELRLRAVDYDETTDTSMSLTICYTH